MMTDDKLHEECAVFGACLTTLEAVGITYNGLLSLQHRGQEGAGIAVVGDGAIFHYKDLGLVSEVFSHERLNLLPAGNIAVGHTRYSTTGSSTKNNVGPFVTEYLTGRIATAHNGNITNAPALKAGLKKDGIHFSATSDSEVISALIAYHTMREKDMLAGVIKACDMLRGAFSLVIAGGDNQLICVRDPNGYRPLCLGHNQAGYVVASESCALDALGFTFVRDVLPGEIIVLAGGEILHQGIRLLKKEDKNGLCIFEYIYFARPDSVIDGVSVYQARYNMGGALAREHPVAADVVCGVPDTGLEAASGFSAQSKIPLVAGFVKNRYIGRSFIYPTQTQRDSAVRLKLNPLSVNIKDKRVVLVDDSIVRGTTSEKIVKSLKTAGAKEVHVRISSPPFRYTCHYGTDIDSPENLIANNMSLDEIRCKINADSLGYISLAGLREACAGCATAFCTACFSGDDPSICTRKDALQ